jgi:threonine dehydrogenase-like Zn-dependent dehydrogenase
LARRPNPQARTTPPTRSSSPQRLAPDRQFTDGVGADVAIEAVGIPATFELAAHTSALKVVVMSLYLGDTGPDSTPVYCTELGAIVGRSDSRRPFSV